MTRTSSRSGAPESTDGGFTLIEILVSLAIVSVLSLATVGMLVTAIRTVRENSDRVYAANLARSAIEAAINEGAEGITLGMTETSATSPEGRTFVITTTSNWVGLNQPTSSCESATPGQSYVRVHVEVSGATLGRSEISDTIIAPSDDTVLTSVGSLAIAVADERGDAVRGVTVRVVDLATSTSQPDYVTGPDGCVFVTRLSPGANWQVTINRAGFVARIANGTVKLTDVVAKQTKRIAFEYAAAAAMEFTTNDEAYPIPDGMPLTMGSDPLAVTAVPVTTYPKTIGNLWPAITGYQAWLGSCLDADPAWGTAPRTATTNRPWYPVAAGRSSAVALGGVGVLVRGLNPKSVVTVTHAAEPSGNCTSPTTYTVGTTNDAGVVSALLPFGQWNVTTPGTPTQQVLLEPTFSRAIVSFPVASLDLPCAPSSTPTSTPRPSPSPTGLVVPDGTVAFGTVAPAAACPSSTATASPSPSPMVTP